jgi:hypothetical protein
VATIINVILKGSALLNRLLSQQASNRKALTEQERQKRERAAVEQKRRQAIAKAAPPSFTRRVEEPAATPSGRLLIVFSTSYVRIDPDGTGHYSYGHAYGLVPITIPVSGHNLTSISEPFFTDIPNIEGPASAGGSTGTWGVGTLPQPLQNTYGKTLYYGSIDGRATINFTGVFFNYNLSFSANSRSTIEADVISPTDLTVGATPQEGIALTTARRTAALKRRDDWLANVPQGYTSRYTFAGLQYDSATSLITFNFTDSQRPGTTLPVRVARSVMAPLFESMRGTVVSYSLTTEGGIYAPRPPSFYEQNTPPGSRWWTINTNIIGP